MDFLYNALDWILKHKSKTIGLVLLAIFIPLFIIHVLFYFPAPCRFLIALWTAGDLMGYYAAFISAIGTIFLGLVAINQNKKLHDDSLKRAAQKELNRIEAIKPELKIYNVFSRKHNYMKSTDSFYGQIIINITNSSAYAAENVRVRNCTLSTGDSNMFINFPLTIESIKIEETKDVMSDSAPLTQKGSMLDFNIHFCDCEHHQYIIRVIVECVKIEEYWKIVICTRPIRMDDVEINL